MHQQWPVSHYDNNLGRKSLAVTFPPSLLSFTLQYSCEVYMSVTEPLMQQDCDPGTVCCQTSDKQLFIQLIHTVAEDVSVLEAQCELCLAVLIRKLHLLINYFLCIFLCFSLFILRTFCCCCCQPIDRKPRVFAPLVIPKDLQRALPFKDKPKMPKSSKDPVQSNRVAVVREPKERQVCGTVFHHLPFVQNLSFWKFHQWDCILVKQLP